MKWIELSAGSRRETLGRFGDALLAMELFCQAIAGSANGWGAASMKRLSEWREYLQNAVTDADRFIELGGGWKDAGAPPLFRHYAKARGWVFALLDELVRGAAPAALIERARNAETECAAGRGMVAAEMASVKTVNGLEAQLERAKGERDLLKSVLKNPPKKTTRRSKYPEGAFRRMWERRSEWEARAKTQYDVAFEVMQEWHLPTSAREGRDLVGNFIRAYQDRAPFDETK